MFFVQTFITYPLSSRRLAGVNVGSTLLKGLAAIVLFLGAWAVADPATDHKTKPAATASVLQRYYPYPSRALLGAEILSPLAYRWLRKSLRRRGKRRIKRAQARWYRVLVRFWKQKRFLHRRFQTKTNVIYAKALRRKNKGYTAGRLYEDLLGIPTGVVKGNAPETRLAHFWTTWSTSGLAHTHLAAMPRPKAESFYASVYFWWKKHKKLLSPPTTLQVSYFRTRLANLIEVEERRRTKVGAAISARTSLKRRVGGALGAFTGAHRVEQFNSFVLWDWPFARTQGGWTWLRTGSSQAGAVETRLPQATHTRPLPRSPRLSCRPGPKCNRFQLLGRFRSTAARRRYSRALFFRGRRRRRRRRTSPTPANFNRFRGNIVKMNRKRTPRLFISTLVHLDQLWRTAFWGQNQLSLPTKPPGSCQAVLPTEAQLVEGGVIHRTSEPLSDHGGAAEQRGVAAVRRFKFQIAVKRRKRTYLRWSRRLAKIRYAVGECWFPPTHSVEEIPESWFLATYNHLLPCSPTSPTLTTPTFFNTCYSHALTNKILLTPILASLPANPPHRYYTMREHLLICFMGAARTPALTMCHYPTPCPTNADWTVHLRRASRAVTFTTRALNYRNKSDSDESEDLLTLTYPAARVRGRTPLPRPHKPRSLGVNVHKRLKMLYEHIGLLYLDTSSDDEMWELLPLAQREDYSEVPATMVYSLTPPSGDVLNTFVTGERSPAADTAYPVYPALGPNPNTPGSVFKKYHRWVVVAKPLKTRVGAAGYPTTPHTAHIYQNPLPQPLTPGNWLRALLANTRVLPKQAVTDAETPLEQLKWARSVLKANTQLSWQKYKLDYRTKERFNYSVISIYNKIYQIIARLPRGMKRNIQPGAFSLAIFRLLVFKEINLWTDHLHQWYQKHPYKAHKRIFYTLRRVLRGTFRVSRYNMRFLGMYFQLKGKVHSKGGMRKRLFRTFHGRFGSSTLKTVFQYKFKQVWCRTGAIGLKTITVHRNTQQVSKRAIPNKLASGNYTYSRPQ